MSDPMLANLLLQKIRQTTIHSEIANTTMLIGPKTRIKNIAKTKIFNWF